MMNPDKAYLFGLIIGGGVFGNAEDVFRIRLPYKKWGSYILHPDRSVQIQRDIMKFVSPLFRVIYNITINYDTAESGDWNILCEGDLSELKADFSAYGIECIGEMRNNKSSIKLLVNDFTDDNHKQWFIAGLADTIGSTNPTHRNRTKDVQIISFAFNGFDFFRICELCKLLHSIKCFPDQVEWNHPNMHNGLDPFYSKWNKGVKVRVKLDQYAAFGRFAFNTKAMASIENRNLQNQTNISPPCAERKVKASIKCFHPDENDTRFPEIVRGGHYLHASHICAVLGCEYAPREKIRELIEKNTKLISPFLIMCRYDISIIERIISDENLMAKRNYTDSEVNVGVFYSQYKSKSSALIMGNNKNSGYPVSIILQCIAYIIADDEDLHGRRPRRYAEVIEKHISINPALTVKFSVPDLLTPLVIRGNGRGALIGAKNPDVYERLISIDPSNKYKLLVRPITEEDLRGAE